MKSAKDHNYLAAAVMFLMPAVSVELLTGNTSLAQYFYPITFVLNNVIYGGALLLIRETVVRWNKGFASVLVLACGYGMLNEALCTKGFFAPQFYAVVADGLEGFGRYFGINVAWALSVSIAHAVFSITVPFVVVTLIFPGSKPWIGDKLYIGLMVLLIAVCAFSFRFIAVPPSYYHYDEGPGPLLLIFALMAIVLFTAWKMPDIRFSKWKIRPHPVLLFGLGAAYIFAFWSLPGDVRAATGSPPIYIAFLLVIFVALPIWLIIKLPEPTARGKVALVAGLLLLLMASSLLGGLTGNPTLLVPFVIVLALLVAAFVRADEPAPRPRRPLER